LKRRRNAVSMFDDYEDEDSFVRVVKVAAPSIAFAIVGTFLSAAWVGRARAETEKARLSVECAQNPAAQWKDDHCERIPEP